MVNSYDHNVFRMRPLGPSYVPVEFEKLNMEVLKGFATAGSVQWFNSTISSDSELSAKKFITFDERT